jgi:hypothetical protein
MVSRRQTPESFWSKVIINKSKLDSCWEWSGSCNNIGYGTVAWRGKVYTAHRVAAWLEGLVETPEAPRNKQTKLFVLHKCDNRKCCNPKHFFLGNYRDNQLDAYAKSRRAQPKGSLHTNAKLTVQEAADIRKSYAQGCVQTQLAKTYNVSQRVISLIVRGETYK